MGFDATAFNSESTNLEIHKGWRKEKTSSKDPPKKILP